jgi:hypothetical protein
MSIQAVTIVPGQDPSGTPVPDVVIPNQQPGRETPHQPDIHPDQEVPTPKRPDVRPEVPVPEPHQPASPEVPVAPGQPQPQIVS